MEKRRLREVLLDQIEYNDLDIKKVIKATEMPEEYLEAILDDIPEKLPAFPYIRVYLVKLAEVLKLNPDEVVESYKKEFSEKISGSQDLLPSNRFSLPSEKKKFILIFAFIIILIFGYWLTTTSFFGKPNIEIAYPPSDPSPYLVNEKIIELRGRIDPSDKLSINQEVVTTDNEGRFIYSYNLSNELNFINFKVEKLLGGSLEVSRQVFFEEIATSTLDSVIEIPSVNQASSTSL